MNILLAWEAGANYGHVTKLVEIARAITKKGGKKINLFFALKEPGVLKNFANGLDYSLLQAPYCSDKGTPDPSHTYAEALRSCGYDNYKTLAGLIEAWRGMFSLIKPDLVIAQAAPTAVLAAREWECKTMIFGGSYDMPPRSEPMQAFRYWENINMDVIAEREEAIVSQVNLALESLGLQRINAFHEILESNAEYMCMFEELDHYPNREEAQGYKPQYFGTFFSIDQGQKLSWNKTAEKRILAYIRTESAGFTSTLEALSMLPDDHDCIVAAPGVPLPIQTQFEKPNMRIIDGPVHLKSLLKNCDVGINHAGMGVSSALALHAVPQLLLPNHIEQMMFARAIGRNKLGRGLAGDFGTQDIAALIEKLLTESEFKDASEAFAKKYKGFKPEKLAVQITDELFKLIG